MRLCFFFADKKTLHAIDSQSDYKMPVRRYVIDVIL